jgi:monoterpene epsilon-lactone hydrolase
MFARPLAEKLLAAFPVDIRPGRIGGVPVEEFTPQGERDADRVLINLHGGAFYSGAVHVARIESIPMCSRSRMRVVSVDYRQGYEHKHPAASEDVMAVYAELLKTYPAPHIGIYGGSAGGALTLQAVAMILAEGLPAPGAIGVFGAGAGGSGDGNYFAAIGTAQPPPVDVFGAIRGSKFGYLSEARRDDPLVNLLHAEESFRARFPPCLLITATRAFDLSPAIATHRALCQAGADASLHVFDGLGHCFYYDATLPEGADAYQTMVRFFRQRLAL